MNPFANQLALEPLGAGDLIDRAVRLYRRHFSTLIRIAAPQVIVFAIGSATFTIAVREISSTASASRVMLYVLMIIAGIAIMLGGALCSLIVMGGAARNLVAHLLWNEPVTFLSTYAAIKSRFWGLVGASLLVALWLTFCSWLAILCFYVLFIVIV